MSDEKNQLENQEITFSEEINTPTEQNTETTIPDGNKSSGIKIEDWNLDDLEIEEIIGVIPLEPCMALASIADSEGSPNQFKRIIGIPGLYNAQHQKFILLDGRPVTSKGFQEKFNQLVQSKNNQSNVTK